MMKYMNVILYSGSLCCCRVSYHHECDVFWNHTRTVYDAFTYCITANAIMQNVSLIRLVNLNSLFCWSGVLFVFDITDWGNEQFSRRKQFVFLSKCRRRESKSGVLDHHHRQQIWEPTVEILQTIRFLICPILFAMTAAWENTKRGSPVEQCNNEVCMSCTSRPI